MFRKQAGAIALLFLLAPLLAGCSPELNWREVHASDGSYSVLMPAKPAAHTRELALGTIKTSMTLSGAEAGGVSYVVGYAAFESEAQAQQAALAMQAGMLRNIGAGQPESRQVMVGAVRMTELSAQGKSPSGQPLTLFARFAARGKHAWQAIVLGPSNKVDREAAQTFLESFHPQDS